MSKPARIEYVGNDLLIHMDDKSTVWAYLDPTSHSFRVRSTPSLTGGGVTVPGGGGFAWITAGMIEAAVKADGGSVAGIKGGSQAVADAFNNAIAKSKYPHVNSKMRAAVLVGECCWESDHFRATAEYGGPSKSYAPYYGRGYIQTTWESNYRAFGEWAVAHGLATDANAFVTNPDQLALIEWAPYTALAYFEQRALWGWVDGGDNWGEVSYRILGSHATDEGRARMIRAALAVAPDKPADSVPAGAGAALDAWMRSHVKRYFYTQDGWSRMHPDQSGGTDCSGTVIACYLQAIGKDLRVNGGGYTGTLMNQGRVVQSRRARIDTSQLQPGDIWLLNWAGSYTPTYDHVVMAIGNGEVASHGGPGNGPVIYKAADYANFGISESQVNRVI